MSADNWSICPKCLDDLTPIRVEAVLGDLERIRREAVTLLAEAETSD